MNIAKLLTRAFGRRGGGGGGDGETEIPFKLYKPKRVTKVSFGYIKSFIKGYGESFVV